MHRVSSAIRAAGEWVLALLAAAWLAAALLCWAPGAGIDEREFDAQQSGEAVAALRAERAGDRSVTHVFGTMLRGLLTGDLGESTVFQRPVAELLRERLPVTASLVAVGLVLAWCAGLACGVFGLMSQGARLVPLALNSLLVSVPAAVVALGCALAGWPAAVAMTVAVWPKIHSYTDQILQRGLRQPYRLMAAARGVGPWRLLTAHLLWPAWPELRALAGVTVPLAFGAAIPIEVFTDTPGVGQLAWRAASGRDVMLLLYITMLLTGLTLLLAPRRAAEAARA